MRMSTKKQKLNRVTAILPFYNEQKTLLIVLKAFAGAKNIDQIILVNDGSRDTSLRLAKQFLQQVNDSRFELINCRSNHGKAAAVGKGLDRAKNEIILLYDADMKHATSGTIERMVNDFLVHDDQLLIAAVTDKPAILKWRFLDFLSGERMFYKNVLLPYRRLLNDDLGYGLEILINHLHRRQKVRLSYDYGQLGHIYKHKDHLNFFGQIASFAKEGVQILGALILIVYLEKLKRWFIINKKTRF